MPVTPSDRNLILGILALQLDFINREQLIAALNAWIVVKKRPLAEVLVEQQSLTTARRDLLETLVEEHLRQNEGDPAQSPDDVIADMEATRSIVTEPAGDAGAPTLSHHSDRSVTETGVGIEPEESAHTLLISVSRVRLQGLHAQGGLGRVYKAQDEALGRLIAVKRIQPQYANRIPLQERFLLEAEVTGNLEHPGIVPIYGVGRSPHGDPFYAMRFVEGDRLKDAIYDYHHPSDGNRSASARSLALRGLLDHFLDICQTVAYAHSRGVLHRDLKPSNVLLGRFGETLIIDWGLARAAGHSGKHSTGDPPETEPTLVPRSGSDHEPTTAGQVLGTVGYMSPEQAAGEIEALGPTTDIFALGAILYAILTGRPPFDAADSAAAIYATRQGSFLAPRTIDPAISAALESICLKAMATRPEDRYPSARGLADDIQRWLADAPVSVHKEGWSERLSRWERRHRTLIRTGGAALALLTLTATFAAVAVGLAWRDATRAQAAAQAREVQVRRFFELGRRTVQAMLDEAAVNLADVPGTELSRLRQTQKALGFIEQYRAALPDETDALRDAAVGYRTASRLHRQLGNPTVADRHADEALNAIRAVCGSPDARPDDQTLEIQIRLDRGQWFRQDGRPAAAEEQYRAVLAALDALPTNTTASTRFLRPLRGQTWLALSACLIDQGRLPEAQAAARQTLEILGPAPDDPDPKERPAINATPRLDPPTPPTVGIATLVDRAARLEDSSQSGVIRATDMIPLLRLLAYENLSFAAREEGDLVQARSAAQEAVIRAENYALRFPNSTDAALRLASARLTRAEARMDGPSADADGAFQDLQRAENLLEPLGRAFQELVPIRQRRAMVHIRRAELNWSANRPESAQQEARRALDILEKLPAEIRDQPETRTELARASLIIGRAALREGRAGEGRARLQQALGLHRSNLTADRNNPVDRKRSVSVRAELEAIAPPDAT